MSTTMIGTLIEDPTIFKSDYGLTRATFELIMERTNGHKVLTTHLKCRAAGRLAVSIGISLHSGDRVIVVGTIEQGGEWNSVPEASGLLLNLAAVGPALGSQKATWQKVESLTLHDPRIR